MSELKACPFCGGNNLKIKGKVECNDCGGMMVYYSNLPVDEEWNTRPLEDALLKRAESAEGELADTKKRLEDALGENEHLRDTRHVPYDALEVAECKADILAAKVKELEAAQEWIPVTERLPEIGFVGLCQVAGNGYTIARYAPYDSLAGWTSDEYGYCAVTHYMPLPQPPKPEGAK